MTRYPRDFRSTPEAISRDVQLPLPKGGFRIARLRPGFLFVQAQGI